VDGRFEIKRPLNNYGSAKTQKVLKPVFE
jgi:hypothetical protein